MCRTHVSGRFENEWLLCGNLRILNERRVVAARSSQRPLLGELGDATQAKVGEGGKQTFKSGLTPDISGARGD